MGTVIEQHWISLVLWTPRGWGLAYNLGKDEASKQARKEYDAERETYNLDHHPELYPWHVVGSSMHYATCPRVRPRDRRRSIRRSSKP